MVGVQGTRQEIEQRVREFEAAFNRRDAAALAAMYTEDARLLPPGSEMLSGRQAIQQFWQGVMDMGVREVDLQTEAVETNGDLAYEIGSATLKIQSQGDSPMTNTVKYVVVWQRRAKGPWQMAVDIWNSDTQT